MAFLTGLICKLAYYGITLGYPAYQVYLNSKQNKVDRLWIIYFFVFGILTILESTILFPVKYLINMICGSTWCFFKLLFSLWLQHPSYRGALLLEQNGGKYIDMIQQITWPIAGRVLNLLGVPERIIPEQEKATTIPPEHK